MVGGGGGGGRVYWGRREAERVEGIVVAFAWSSSVPERNLKSFVDLYATLRWNTLVCHADFVTPFFPEKATPLAINVLNELVEELRARPSPIVFAAFSGGPKACMYKILQIIEGTCEAHLNWDDNQLLRNCISGHIYDSGPVDFTSDMGARFALHPAILRMPGPVKLASWIAKGVASGLDALFLTRFECQRTQYWETLCSSVGFGAPFLILCSKNDDLAPYHVICKFAQRLQDLGGHVEITKWNSSSHVGHYEHYPIQYRAAVTELLEKATAVYCRRRQQIEREKNGLDGFSDEISELICNLQNAAVSSKQSLTRVALGPSDHFYLPSSSGSQNRGDSGSLEDEQRERMVLLETRPGIGGHSVLGQVLFDVCVPKNVDGWDIKFSGSVNGQPFASARRRSPLHAFKCIRRSRL